MNLLDIKSNWRDEFFVKYCVERSVLSLEAIDVRFICRQVLEALSLFCALSIPFGALCCCI